MLEGQKMRSRSVGPPYLCNDECSSRVGEENVKEIFNSYLCFKDQYA